MTGYVVAVVIIGVVSVAAIIALGAVQNARTRAMTRKRLDEAIPDINSSNALGTLSHNASSDRVKQATSELNPDEFRQAIDDARSMEDR